jgi:catechol 2,3-dioxygenase-like lactoylglutathione lyase family enzyme
MQARELSPLFNVTDMRASLAFYVDGLGFELREEYELEGETLWVALQSGDAKLMLNRTTSADASTHSSRRRAAPSYSGLVLYLYVDDARTAHAELSAKGLSPGEVEQEEYGLEEFYLRDPDGYEIGIGSPLPPWVKGHIPTEEES